MTRVLCAWHPRYFPGEAVPVLREHPEEGPGVSHGICPDCRERVRQSGAVAGRRSGDGPTGKVRQQSPGKKKGPRSAPWRTGSGRSQSPVDLRRGRKKTLLGTYTVRSYGGQETEVAVHRQGRDILLDDHPVQPWNLLGEPGWRKELYFLLPNIVSVRFNQAA